jgi:hypothetical protein
MGGERLRDPRSARQRLDLPRAFFRPTGRASNQFSASRASGQHILPPDRSCGATPWLGAADGRAIAVGPLPWRDDPFRCLAGAQGAVQEGQIEEEGLRSARCTLELGHEEAAWDLTQLQLPVCDSLRADLNRGAAEAPG